eukprot:Sspe_Gene.99522::Locus_73115_Transcript_1_1_Confidence_1.000_Length_403::g.99522::m.99522
MSQAVMAAFGVMDHPHAREFEEGNKPMAKHISPEYYLWTQNHKTKGDFSWVKEPNGFKVTLEKEAERAVHPCTWDEYIDVSCRSHPANKFAAKMTKARPGEY